MLTINAWVSRCATRYANMGHVADDVAQDMAEGWVSLLTQQHGTNPDNWTPPEQAADSDIESWTDD